MYKKDKEENSQSNPSKPAMTLTHKDMQYLLSFVTNTGKILPRRITKLSAREQRYITKTIKRARNLLMIR